MPSQLSFFGIDTKQEMSLQDFDTPKFAPLLKTAADIFMGEQHELLVIGEAGSGKTHLLSAIYRQYVKQSGSAIYLSLNDLSDNDTQALTGLELFELVIIDDLHLIKESQVWQEALFHFINRIRVHNTSLIFGSQYSAQDLELELLDLTTRLAQALVFLMPNGSDIEDRTYVLKSILHQKGWYLPDDIFAHFVHEGPHHAGDMVKVLNAIMPYFTANKRKLSQKTKNDIKEAIRHQSLMLEISDITFDDVAENGDNQTQLF